MAVVHFTTEIGRYGYEKRDKLSNALGRFILCQLEIRQTKNVPSLSCDKVSAPPCAANAAIL